MALDPAATVELAREPEFSLGALRVNPAAREVLSSGRVEVLEPRVMQVLVALARRRGAVVARDDLVRDCWEGRVVGEDAITRCIAKVRRVAETHGGFAVETIARVGYRLSETGAAPAAAAPTTDAVEPARRGLRPLWLAGTAALFAIAAVVWFFVPSTAITDRSIAVLPFENRSEARENAYLALGIQDEIVTLLTRVGELRVSSRNSTVRYAGSSTPLPRIGRELGVAYLLEGNVQRVGDEVLVHVALLDAAADRHVWAASYERSAADVFAIESEVAQAVARALEARLTDEEREGIVRPPTANPAAYDAYLRARAFAERTTRTESEIRAAIAAFEEAVRLDPEFVIAWAQLARRHSNFFSLGYDRSDARRDAASRALTEAKRLRPDLLEVQLAHGFYLITVEGDLDEAERLYRELETRYPAVADVAAGLGSVLGDRGELARSVDYNRRVLALDAMNPYRHAINCYAFVQMRQFDVAREACERALELLPGDIGILSIEAALHQARGELAESRDLLRALAPAPDDWRTLRTMSRQLLLDREHSAAAALLAKYLATPEALGTLRGVVRRWHGDALRLAGDIEAARSAYGSAQTELGDQLARQPDNPLLVAELAIVQARLGDGAQAAELVKRCEPLASRSGRQAFKADCRHARLHAALAAHDVDEALAVLNEALQSGGGSGLLPLTPELLRVDPELDPLREHTGFRALH